MKRLFALTLVVLLLGVPSAIGANNQNGMKDVLRAFPVRLLPGYEAKVTYGIDSWNAKIEKDGGATIDSIRGSQVGVESDSIQKDEVTRREEQGVTGQQVICVYTKLNDFLVSIPKLAVNFGAHIRNQLDLAEMLLMVLTYRPVHGYPFESGTVEFPRPEDPR